jgi:hypothetical protein
MFAPSKYSARWDDSINAVLIRRLFYIALPAGAAYGVDFAQPYKDRLSGLNPRDPQYLADLFFFGFDNTPTYDRQTGKILAEVIVSWSNLASQDRSSHYQALAAALPPRLKRNANRLSKSDHELFQIHGFGEVFDRWLTNLPPQ